MGSSCSSDQTKKDKDGKSKSSKKGKKGVDKSPRGSTASNSSLYVYQKAPTPPPEREASSAISSTGQGDMQPLLAAAEEDKHTAAQRVDSQPLSPTSPNQIAQSPKDQDSPAYSEFPEVSRRLLLGDVKNTVPALKPRRIILFIFADSKDSVMERAALMGSIYKKLRESCAARGYELDVLDMHWGLDSKSASDYFLRDISVHELKRCCEEFLLVPVVFLNEALGSDMLPLNISTNDWDYLQDKLSADESQQELLKRWYALDENEVPACYKLLLSNNSSLSEITNDKATTWQNDQATLLEIFQSIYSNDQLKPQLSSYLENLLNELKSYNDQVSKTCMLIMRRFIQRPPQVTQELEQCPSQTRLVELQTHFQNQVDEGHVLRFTLHWKDEKIDPDGIPEHAQYLDDLCAQFQIMFMGIVDSLAESVESKGPDAGYLGMEKRVFHELIQQSSECKREIKHFVGQGDMIGKIDAYVNGTTNKPLIVHGPPGCGKTALLAKAIHKCSEWLPNAPVVFRFVGLTSHSSTTEQILRSICEQCCLLYGVHPSLASQNVAKLQKQLPILLEKVSPSRSLVIFIDGLDDLQSYGSISVDWIPLSLPEHVKLILSFRDNSSQLQELKALIGDDSCFIEIPKSSTDQCFEIVQRVLQEEKRTISKSQEAAIRTSLQQCPVPLYAAIVATQACSWPSTLEEPSLSGDLDKQIISLFEDLEKKFGEKALQRILGYLTCAKQGVTSSEMGDLLSCDGVTFQQNGSNDDFYRVSPVIWIYIQRNLRCFIRNSLINYNAVTRWWDASLRAVSEQRYFADDGLRNLSSSLVDYFQSRWLDVKREGHSSGRDVDCLILSQPVQYGSRYNQRKLDELPFHLHRAGKIMDEVSPWEPEWLLAKLCGSDVYMLLEDLTLFEPSPDLQLLREFLEISAYALAYDGMQLYTQVVGRMSSPDPHRCPQMSSLYELSCHAPIPSLLPMEICLQPLDAKEDEEEDGDTIIYFDSLHFLKNSTTHAVSLSANRGEIIVWSIYEQKDVRTLTGLDQPREIKMVDEHRGLVLCNRELKLYNLDEASFEVKLKGVMNQKMPFYGLHDANHVVSLSRNRMYVHMTTLQTGDCVANFKVGEDRFLNSLLVSANGKMCVCGDETQKPFPLLVWDLESRKLVYDLRIPHHEFLTNLSAITNDGHYVVSVCKEVDFPSPNFIIVYDLQSGTLFKKWKPEVNTCSIAISSEGGCVISGLEDASILVWDLVTGACRFSLTGHCAPPDHIRLNECGDVGVTYDSTGQDRSIRVWNIVKGHSVAVYTSDSFVSCCELSPDGGAVVLGLQGRKQILTLVLCNQQTLSDRVQPVPLFGNADNTGKVSEAKENV